MTTPEAEPLLSLDRVGKRFGPRPVLRDVDLSLLRGESLALVGENGAGKSTLLRIIAGLESHDDGEVTLRGRVGFCPQEPGLLDLLTADEHIVFFGRGMSLGAAESRAQGHRLLGEFGFPERMRGVVSKKLSGGSRQKLNLALALLGEPDLLLLDEPYTGFDQGTYVCFWEHVRSWTAAGRGVVIVTHFLNEIERVDRIHELTPCLAEAA